MLLQERKQGMLFALIVLVNVHQLVRTLPQLQQLVLADVSVFQCGNRVDGFATLCDHLADSSILSAKGIDRMAGSNRAGGKLYQNLPRHLRVKVAHGPDLLDRHTTGNQFLLVCRTISRNWPLTASGASP